MASRQVHVVVLSLSLMLILVLLLVTATVYKAPTASPRYPKHHLLRRTNNHQQQQRHRAVSKVVQDRAVNKVVQEAEGGEGEEGEVAAAGGGREEQERRLQVESDAMATIGRGKTWPHLVGLDAEEAKKKILEEHPNLQVQVVPAGGMMTMDYNLHRVRIFKDAAQKVTTAPKLG